jgi:hypothetical protein
MDFYFNFKFFRGITKRFPLLSLGVLFPCKCLNVTRGIQCLLANAQRVLQPFDKNCYLQKLPTLLRTLSEDCQFPLIPGNKFARGLLTNLWTHLQEGCPNNINRGNVSAISLKKRMVLKTITGASPKYALHPKL